MIDQIVDALVLVASKIPALGRQRRDVEDNALRAVSHSLNETYLYYGRLERGAPRDHEAEAQLSRLWSAAAIPLRHLDAELAARCEYKAEYWLNPEGWSEQRVREIGIRLDDVRHRYRRLLTPERLGKPFPQTGH
jgi:hypothetical protein